MSSQSNEIDKDELIDNINKKKADGISDYEYPIGCDSIKNEDNKNNIREGNNAYLILTKQKENWFLENIICCFCSVRDKIERIDKSTYIAIVEVKIKIGQNRNIEFQNPQIWDIEKK